jgi:hypothetical protein
MVLVSLKKRDGVMIEVEQQFIEREGSGLLQIAASFPSNPLTPLKIVLETQI